MGLLRIGDNAPEFNVNRYFAAAEVTEYSLAGCKGKWLVLFFYPADFTFICPTEVTGFSKMAQGLRRRRLRSILGASVDSIDSHRSWAEELGGLEYPLLSDESKNLSQRLRRARRKRQASRCAQRLSSIRPALSTIKSSATSTSAAAWKKRCAC